MSDLVNTGKVFNELTDFTVPLAHRAKGAVLVRIGDYIYILGGLRSDNTKAARIRYKLGELRGTWEEVTLTNLNMVSGVYRFIVTGDRLYLFANITTNTNPLTFNGNINVYSLPIDKNFGIKEVNLHTTLKITPYKTGVCPKVVMTGGKVVLVNGNSIHYVDLTSGKNNYRLPKEDYIDDRAGKPWSNLRNSTSTGDLIPNKTLTLVPNPLGHKYGTRNGPFIDRDHLVIVSGASDNLGGTGIRFPLSPTGEINTSVFEKGVTPSTVYGTGNSGSDTVKDLILVGDKMYVCFLRNLSNQNYLTFWSYLLSDTGTNVGGYLGSPTMGNIPVSGSSHGAVTYDNKFFLVRSSAGDILSYPILEDGVLGVLESYTPDNNPFKGKGGLQHVVMIGDCITVISDTHIMRTRVVDGVPQSSWSVREIQGLFSNTLSVSSTVTTKNYLYLLGQTLTNVRFVNRAVLYRLKINNDYSLGNPEIVLEIPQEQLNTSVDQMFNMVIAKNKLYIINNEKIFVTDFIGGENNYRPDFSLNIDDSSGKPWMYQRKDSKPGIIVGTEIKPWVDASTLGVGQSRHNELLVDRNRLIRLVGDTSHIQISSWDLDDESNIIPNSVIWGIYPNTHISRFSFTTRPVYLLGNRLHLFTPIDTGTNIVPTNGTTKSFFKIELSEAGPSKSSLFYKESTNINTMLNRDLAVMGERKGYSFDTVTGLVTNFDILGEVEKDDFLSIRLETLPLEEYEDLSKEWTEIVNMKPSPEFTIPSQLRNDLTCVLRIGTYVYIFGGHEEKAEYGRITFFNDQLSGKWEIIKPENNFKFPQGSYYGFTTKDYLYLVFTETINYLPTGKVIVYRSKISDSFGLGEFQIHLEFNDPRLKEKDPNIDSSLYGYFKPIILKNKLILYNKDIFYEVSYDGGSNNYRPGKPRDLKFWTHSGKPWRNILPYSKPGNLLSTTMTKVISSTDGFNFGRTPAMYVDKGYLSIFPGHGAVNMDRGIRFKLNADGTLTNKVGEKNFLLPVTSGSRILPRQVGMFNNRIMITYPDSSTIMNIVNAELGDDGKIKDTAWKITRMTNESSYHDTFTILQPQSDTTGLVYFKDFESRRSVEAVFGIISNDLVNIVQSKFAVPVDPFRDGGSTITVGPFEYNIGGYGVVTNNYSQAIRHGGQLSLGWQPKTFTSGTMEGGSTYTIATHDYVYAFVFKEGTVPKTSMNGTCYVYRIKINDNFYLEECELHTTLTFPASTYLPIDIAIANNNVYIITEKEIYSIAIDGGFNNYRPLPKQFVN